MYSLTDKIIVQNEELRGLHLELYHAERRQLQASAIANQMTAKVRQEGEYYASVLARIPECQLRLDRLKRRFTESSLLPNLRLGTL